MVFNELQKNHNSQKKSKEITIRLMLHQNRGLQGSSALKSSEGSLIHESYSFLEQIADGRLQYRVAWLILVAESLRVRDRRAKTSKYICVRQVNFTCEALVSSPNHRILTAESERNSI